MKSAPNRFVRRWNCAIILAVVLVGSIVVVTGCSRSAYREMADRDAYRLLRSRQTDSRWDIPDRVVEADPRSRLHDSFSPDCGPLPPDDPAAQGYMQCPFNSRKGVTYWDEKGESYAVDQEEWIAHLPYNEDGEVLLDKQLSVDLGLLHSRQFQSQVEQLHIRALDLSSNRFEYQLNWFGGSDWGFNSTEDGADAERDLGNSNQLGFTRNLATGGQFAANLANSFAWSFGGSGSSNFAAGNLVFSLTQPLLRGAFRHVRTESLTQSERSLLYEVRDFARFRRQFYLDIVSQYLGLLNQAQGLRNEQENLRNLQLSLEEHEFLYENGRVSPIQVDQIFQDYQSGRLSIINAEQSLQNSLDQFKFQLGLPARVPVKLDETILKPFQLNSPEVESLQNEIDELKQSLTKYLPPEEAPEEFLDQVIVNLKKLSERLEDLKSGVDEEYEIWKEKLEEKRPPENASEDESIDFRQEESLLNRIGEFLVDLELQIENAKKSLQIIEAGKWEDLQNPQPVSRRREPDDQADGELNQEKELTVDFDDDDTDAVKQWRAIQFEIAKTGGLKERISTLFVAQTQIRLFLISLKPLEVDEKTAVGIALQNRLDLMNSKAAVVDAYRQVEIAADRLESDVTVSASANLRSDPTVDNAFRFDGDENVYNLGLEVDGPLNRLNERNSYRIAQIGYQQQRRAYMADEDSIVNSVRLNLRQLLTNRSNFAIARQQLITATRQLEQAQFNLRTAGEIGDSSLTQDVLRALQTLNRTKNQLISSWVRYEISRISLFVDLELLMLDQQGNWVNERESFSNSGGRAESASATVDPPGPFGEPGESAIDQPTPQIESGSE